MQRCDYFSLGPYALRVEYTEHQILRSQIVPSMPSVSTRPPTGGLAQRLYEQIAAYMDGELTPFDLPLEATLASHGSPFQQRVWAQLLAIPAGQVCTYGELAKTLQTAAQPVGGACRDNPLAFFVPCHRVVSKAGLGGYAGQWGDGPQTAIKGWLLQHEQALPMSPRDDRR